MAMSGIAGLVSVIMPVYRGQRFVVAAIQSVLVQSYQSFELIIVNDGSPDDSAQEIARFLPHPRIRYIEQKNGGVASARNTGIEHSAGSVIALLDQDDVWLPDKLEHQMAVLEAQREIGLLHSRVGCIDASGALRSCEGAIRVQPLTGLCAGQLLAGNGIAPLTVLMRRHCLDSVGGFDQQFAPADDWDLWIRIARRYPIAFMDKITAMYRFHGGNVSSDLLIMQHAIARVVEAACTRFPDIVQSIDPSELAAIRSRVLSHTAEALAIQGRRREARNYWKDAYKTDGDFEALLALAGLSVPLRRRLDNWLGSTPYLGRPLRWYLHKAITRYWAHSQSTIRQQ